MPPNILYHLKIYLMKAQQCVQLGVACRRSTSFYRARRQLLMYQMWFSLNQHYLTASMLSELSLLAVSSPEKFLSDANAAKVNKLITMSKLFRTIFQEAVAENMKLSKDILKIKKQQLRILKDFRADSKKLTEEIMAFLSHLN